MEIVVGVSEFGGFGDVVAAAKIGEVLAMQGHDVAYNFYHGSAQQKAEELFPGLEFPLGHQHDEYEYGKPLKIDVIKSNRANGPDIFVGEVDRRTSSDAPILVMPGFNKKFAYVSTPIVCAEGGSVVAEFQQLTPVLYRPFDLDRLPSPGEENIRRVLTENVRSMDGRAAKNALGECQRIGVCYTYNHGSMLGFLDLLQDAAAASSEKLGVVALTKAENERDVKKGLSERHPRYTIIGSDGEVHRGRGSNVVVAVVKTQPQELTTRLFWSSEMPNYVTGGQSLSDAVYGLVFGKGQGFLYETNAWKVSSRDGMFKIMKDFDPDSARTFMQCTDLITTRDPNEGNPMKTVFSDGKLMDVYTHVQREAFVQAFRRNNPVFTPDSVTVQGAIGRVVAKINADPSLLFSLRHSTKYAPYIIEDGHKSKVASGLAKKSKVG